ncbi:MAG: hypothetical protein J6O70_05045 [Lachnospiraceae bacterium]|nr:hypothetical protein [Lachnospiraceae bacterium]
MVELSNERVDQILHEESKKTEELITILRGIYIRYMRLYERYFDDMDALNDDKIAELNKYHEETRSLIKYYYMDIPQDICIALIEFDDQYSANLLGPDWHRYLLDSFNEFRADNGDKSEACLKADFADKNLTAFYEAMDYIFRDGFGTASESANKIINKFAGALFGES